MAEFRFDHWPVSLALLVPALAVAATRAFWVWASDWRARRRALRALLAPGRRREGQPPSAPGAAP